MSWARGLPGQDSVASPLQAPPSGPSGVGCPRGRVKRASFMAPGARLWAPACLTWGPVQLWPPQVPRGARFPPWWGDGHCGSWMPAPMCPSGHTGHSRPLGVAWDELGVQRRESLGLWGFPRTPSLAPRRPAPCPDTEVAMLAVTFRLFPSGWTPPSPSLGQVCAVRAASASGFAFFIPAALRAGPCGCRHHQGASPEAMGKGKDDQPTVPLPVSDPASPQGPGDWSHCPALAPPTPAVSGHLFFSIPPAVTLQGGPDTGGRMGESQGQGPSREPSCSPKAFPNRSTASPLPAQRLPSQVFLIWGAWTLPSGFCRQEAFNRKQMGAQGALSPSCPVWECHWQAGFYLPPTPHL